MELGPPRLVQLEDRLPSSAAHERVVQDELNQVRAEKRSDAMGLADLNADKRRSRPRWQT